MYYAELNLCYTDFLYANLYKEVNKDLIFWLFCFILTVKMPVSVKFYTDSEKMMPKLLDRVRALLRMRHYSYETEKRYIYWIRLYIGFHNIRNPLEMGAAEVEAFLSHLAVNCAVSASTQN